MTRMPLSNQYIGFHVFAQKVWESGDGLRSLITTPQGHCHTARAAHGLLGDGACDAPCLPVGQGASGPDSDGPRRECLHNMGNQAYVLILPPRRESSLFKTKLGRRFINSSTTHLKGAKWCPGRGRHCVARPGVGPLGPFCLSGATPLRRAACAARRVRRARGKVRRARLRAPARCGPGAY